MGRVRIALDVLVSLSVLAAFVIWVLWLRLAVSGSRALLVALISAGIAGAVHVVLHEAGHAVVAVALGLRVRGIRLFGRRIVGRPSNSGGPNHVLTNGGELYPPPAARLVLVALAGPAVNIAIAVFAAGMAMDPGSAAYSRAVAAGVAASGAVMGFGNLVPMTRAGRASDGLNVLRRSFGARRRAREMLDARGRLPSGTYSIDPERARLEAAAVDPRADVAGPALVGLLAGSIAKVGAEAAVWRHYQELIVMTKRPDLPARLARPLAGYPGRIMGQAVLHRLVSQGVRPDSTEVERIVELLEAGLDHAPDDLVIRIGLGLGLLLQDRDEEARRMLLDLNTYGRPSDEVGPAYAVRAQAEAACGDLDQAERLIRVARDVAPDDALVRFSAWLIDRALIDRARSGSDSGTIGEGTGTRQTPLA